MPSLSFVATRARLQEMRFSLVVAPPLHPTEKLIASVSASRQQAGHARLIGGRVFLTSERLLHLPGPAERLARGQQWEAALHDIADVTVGGRFRASGGSSAVQGAVTAVLIVYPPCSTVARNGQALRNR